jgi:hypothetical protein
MNKIPLPSVDGEIIRFNGNWDYHNWVFRERIYEHELWGRDYPGGWGSRWPDLPNPDVDFPEISLDKINLSIPGNFCNTHKPLGYYMSWHIVAVSFRNQYGRPPMDGEELQRYNATLPEENRFGIHICCNTIDQYIERFSTYGLDPSHVQSYREYCAYLTLIYVIAHEWGHYRSEVLSFQISNLVKSVSGGHGHPLSPSYLSYFVHLKEHPRSSFEEVFAEWSALKLGVFNYHMKKPAFANSMSNWPQVEATVKTMLCEAISRQTRSRPYSDIRYWVDFDNITKDDILQRLSANDRGMNRAVNDNVLIEEIRSFKSGKMIDLLMHNQMQFSKGHRFNGIVRSAPMGYPLEPDSSFYHFGEDECMSVQKPSRTGRFLQLSDPDQQNSLFASPSITRKVIGQLKQPKAKSVFLPIRVFPEILPLDPVYLHF